MSTNKTDSLEVAIRLKTVAKLLKDARVASGYTQKDVAKHLNYTTAQFVSNWERGLALPPTPALPKLAKLFGLDKTEIIDAIEAYDRELISFRRRQLEEEFTRQNI